MKSRPVASWIAGTALGLVLGVLLAKAMYLLAALGNPFALYGWHALIRTIPTEFSFFGGALGFVLGFRAGVKLTGGPVREFLDALSLPFCLLIALLRFGTLFLDAVGLGEFRRLGLPYVEDGSPLAFFPLGIQDKWGDWWLAVGFLEALVALGCAVYALIRRKTYAHIPGLLFLRCCIILCTGQVVLEFLHNAGTVSYFVHTEQAFAAICLLVITIIAARRIGKRNAGIAPWKYPALLLVFAAINGLVQFWMDKPYWVLSLLPEAAGNWLSEHLNLVGFMLLFLSALAMGATALRAVSRAYPAGGDQQA